MLASGGKAGELGCEGSSLSRMNIETKPIRCFKPC